MISLIVAMDHQRLIGRGNELPWRLRDDLRRFRKLTMGKPVIMGRKTFESIGKPLDGRRNIVLSRRTDFAAEGIEVFATLAAARAAVADAEEVMVIGGADIYRAFLPDAGRIYLTEVEGDFDGDVFFPDFAREEWTEVESALHDADERNPHPHRFSILERS